MIFRHTLIILFLIVILSGCSHLSSKQDKSEETPLRATEMPLKNDNPLVKIANLCSLGEWEQAYKIMDQLFHAEEENPLYWNQVGNCFSLQGDPLMAKFYFKLGVQLSKEKNVDI